MPRRIGIGYLNWRVNKEMNSHCVKLAEEEVKKDLRYMQEKLPHRLPDTTGPVR